MRKHTHKFEIVPFYYDECWQIGNIDDVRRKNYVFLASGIYTVYEPSGRPEHGDYDPGDEHLQITDCQIVVGKTLKHLPMNHITDEWIQGIVMSCIDKIIAYEYR